MYLWNDGIDTNVTSHGLGQIAFSVELSFLITHCACVTGKFLATEVFSVYNILSTELIQELRFVK